MGSSALCRHQPLAAWGLTMSFLWDLPWPGPLMPLGSPQARSQAPSSLVLCSCALRAQVALVVRGGLGFGASPRCLLLPPCRPPGGGPHTRCAGHSPGPSWEGLAPRPLQLPELLLTGVFSLGGVRPVGAEMGVGIRGTQVL